MQAVSTSYAYFLKNFKYLKRFYKNKNIYVLIKIFRLEKVKIPVLFINSGDDPVCKKENIPISKI